VVETSTPCGSEKRTASPFARGTKERTARVAGLEISAGALDGPIAGLMSPHGALNSHCERFVRSNLSCAKDGLSRSCPAVWDPASERDPKAGDSASKRDSKSGTWSSRAKTDGLLKKPGSRVVRPRSCSPNPAHEWSPESAHWELTNALGLRSKSSRFLLRFVTSGNTSFASYSAVH